MHHDVVCDWHPCSMMGCSCSVFPLRIWYCVTRGSYLDFIMMMRCQCQNGCEIFSGHWTQLMHYRLKSFLIRMERELFIADIFLSLLWHSMKSWMLSQAEEGIFYGLQRGAEKRHLVKQMKKMKIPYLYIHTHMWHAKRIADNFRSLLPSSWWQFSRKISSLKLSQNVNLEHWFLKHHH